MSRSTNPGPIYAIYVGTDLGGSGAFGCVVSRDGQGLHGRYDFGTEDEARLWGERCIAQYEDMRLHPQSLDELSAFAKRIAKQRPRAAR